MRGYLTDTRISLHWIVAWQHQAITKTVVDLSSNIFVAFTWEQVLMNLIQNWHVLRDYASTLLFKSNGIFFKHNKTDANTLSINLEIYKHHYEVFCDIIYIYIYIYIGFDKIL